MASQGKNCHFLGEHKLWGQFFLNPFIYHRDTSHYMVLKKISVIPSGKFALILILTNTPVKLLAQVSKNELVQLLIFFLLNKIYELKFFLYYKSTIFFVKSHVFEQFELFSHCNALLVFSIKTTLRTRINVHARFFFGIFSKKNY